MAELKKGLSWSGRMHYLHPNNEKPGHPGRSSWMRNWALCGASPYPIDGEDLPRHLRQELTEGKEHSLCKKCEKAAAKL